MSRLFRLILVLIAVHITLIGVVHLLTRNEQPAFLEIFTNPDGTPCEEHCIFGVRPGKTSMDEAIEAVQRHWLLSDVQLIQSDESNYLFFANAEKAFPSKRLRIWLVSQSIYENLGKTAAISFGLLQTPQHQHNTPLDFTVFSNLSTPAITSSGTLMNFFGQPTAWAPPANSMNAAFYFFAARRVSVIIVPSRAVGLTADPHQFNSSPDDAVLYIGLYETTSPLASFALKWCGFTLRTCEPAN